MAIYLPKQKLIIDVVDDPCRDRVDVSAFPGLAVVPLTCSDLAQFDAARAWRGNLAATGREGAQPAKDGAA